MRFTKDPLRLIIGGVLVVLGVLLLLGVNIPYGGTILAVLGIVVGVLMVVKTKYL